MTLHAEALPRRRRARGVTLAVLRRGLSATPELIEGIGLTLALALLAGAGRMVTPVLVQQVIDHHLTKGQVRLEGVLPLALAGAGLVMLTALAARATQRRLARNSERGLAGLRIRAFRHIHALSIAHHHEERRGALVSRVTSDVETLSDFLRWGGLSFVVNGALMLAALVTMTVYDWRLTLVALVVMLPVVPVLRYMQRRLVAAWDAVRARVGELLSAFSESIMGAAVIRAYRSQHGAQRRMAAANERRRRAEIRAGTIGAVLFPVSEVFSALAIAAVVAVGMLLGPGGDMSTGKLVAFAFLVAIFLQPVADLTELLDFTQQAIAGWRRVLDVLDTPIEVVEPDPGRDVPPGALEVAIDHLWFAYHGGPPVLRDISCTIPAGTRVALVGPTGSGKTTLAKLLIRLADPTAGSIRVGGLDLREITSRSRRSAVVLVPQDGFLFDTTVAENIRQGRPDAGDREIRAACEELGLGAWVDSLPEGLGTRVGQRGERLSVGERQLIALARGYLANPGCLILDEATSAVDPATEMRLRDAIQRLTAGRTAITVAHRLSAAENADLVLVIERGRLVEQGRHQELLAAHGAYARLYASWRASLEQADQEEPGPHADANRIC
ncbi:MAG TPA: ABC transporter ATP-binding protein [Actinomycetes bacterium]|jgi:putative ABC transport system ATP-binding protein|nr:ABC transporter ATP-binding protein [Actinomycetes bacterium]